MFIINTFSTCLGHHYAHLQETKTCVTARGVLCWFCWMWLVAVVGRCVAGCEHQPHPAEPAQHTTCSNTRIVLLKMGIMMPQTCWESVDNKHLTVASCWFSLSLHILLTMHGHRNLKKPHVCGNKFSFVNCIFCELYRVWQTCHDQFDVSVCDLSKCCFRPSLAETWQIKFHAACWRTTLPMWPCTLAPCYV